MLLAIATTPWAVLDCGVEGVVQQRGFHTIGFVPFAVIGRVACWLQRLARGGHDYDFVGWLRRQ